MTLFKRRPASSTPKSVRVLSEGLDMETLAKELDGDGRDVNEQGPSAEAVGEVAMVPVTSSESYSEAEEGPLLDQEHTDLSYSLGGIRY